MWTVRTDLQGEVDLCHVHHRLAVVRVQIQQLLIWWTESRSSEEEVKHSIVV